MVIIHQPTTFFSQRRVISWKACIADSFLSRLLGLMFRRGFGAAMDALVLKPCGSIHTFFMRFAIDAVFVDDNNTVSDVAHGLSPGRVFVPVTRSRTVIELPAGTAGKFHVAPGDLLYVEKLG